MQVEVSRKMRKNESMKMPNVGGAMDISEEAEGQHNDFVNVLAARGLKYDTPTERRGTTLRPAPRTAVK